MMLVITDRNARSVSVEYVIDATGRNTVLVVETDLQLDEIETDFDRAAVDALCRDLAQHRAENPYLDAIRLVRRTFSPPTPVKLTGRLGDQEFENATKRTSR
ncbi:hypothetical protein V1291_004947 [Nitrobacteraceae bacterium AZCC 1564]